jgi:hypothetical protein
VDASGKEGCSGNGVQDIVSHRFIIRTKPFHSIQLMKGRRLQHRFFSGCISSSGGIHRALPWATSRGTALSGPFKLTLIEHTMTADDPVHTLPPSHFASVEDAAGVSLRMPCSAGPPQEKQGRLSPL